MIPDTVFGLLVVAAGLGPGYLFVRLGELRNPRPSRSALLEFAELVTVGGSCTVVVLSVALPVTRKTGKVDLNALSKEGRDYTLAHPVPVFTLLISVLVGSYALAAIAALVVHRGAPATLRHHSVWHEVLRRQGALQPFATVELRDGRTVAGPVAFYTLQEAAPEHRELVLMRPIRARPDGHAEFVDVPDDRVVLRASDVSALSVTYVSS